MTSGKLLEKLNEILQFIEIESNKPLDNHNFETRLWSKGYSAAMNAVKNIVRNIFNKIQ